LARAGDYARFSELRGLDNDIAEHRILRLSIAVFRRTIARRTIQGTPLPGAVGQIHRDLGQAGPKPNRLNVFGNQSVVASSESSKMASFRNSAFNHGLGP
jgi:hypothetical protein